MTRISSKAQCRQAASNDRGPHVATFPGDIVLRFTIPDSSQLARSGKLPDRLRKVALICAAHPEGPDGYMADVAFRAIASGTFEETMSEAISAGLEMSSWLLSEMLVEPSFTPEELDAGALSEPVTRMLLEFAERKRDTDAAGNKLPIITLEAMATFRPGPSGNESQADGEPDRPEPPGAVPEPDGSTV
jgi:hypothetical protein